MWVESIVCNISVVFWDTVYKYVGIISAYRCAFRYKIAANFCVGQSTVQNSQGIQCLET